MFALTAHAPCPSRFSQRRRLLVHPLVGRIVMKSRMPVLLDVRRPQPLCDNEFRQESSESIELLELNL
jgi:hypothetical protein